MRITMKHVWYIFVLCAAFMGQAVNATDTSGTVSFSFDQLYPTTSISRALNSLRYVWSLAQDLNDNQYDADSVRHVWLELYGACDQLVIKNRAEAVMHDAAITSLHLPDDVIEYIKNVWHLIGKAYDQIQLEDVSLGQFLGHMRIACSQVIDTL